MRRRPLLIAMLACLAVLVTVLPANARSPIAIGAIDPDGGVPHATSMSSVLDDHAARVDRQPALWTLWSKWGSRGGLADCQPGMGSCAFPTESVDALMDRGITPAVWWVPIDPEDPKAGTYERYKRVLQGRHDKYIVAWARAARDTAKANGGKLVFVRWAHESQGHWFPWGIGRFDNTEENYKAAFRYIWRKFRAVGATRYVRFVWSQVKPDRATYPGDRYVDYVGVTVLNFGGRRWRTPKSLLDERVGKASRFGKPVLIAEMGSNHKGGNKAKWLRTAYDYAYRRYPRLKGIMYLDTDEPHRLQGQPDWRLIKPTDGSALRAYRSIAANSRFKGRIR